MRILRASCVLPLAALFIVFIITLPFYSFSQVSNGATLLRDSLYSYLPSYSFRTSARERDSVKPFDYSKVKRRYKYAFTTSVQTHSYAAIALALGHSIKRHNDLEALDAEMILLARKEGEDGVTDLNVTNLEKVGWKVKFTHDLEFKGVDISDVRSWHRHNFNKLALWTWTQYEKVIFVDADVLCKGPVKDMLSMPGDFAASPDVWWNVLTDNRFNSGVIIFRPSMEEYALLYDAVSDPKMHNPWEADQAFLNNFYKFRYYGMPYKFNLNLVMVPYWREEWDSLWDEAVFVHYTVRKPKEKLKDHCTQEKGCREWEQMEYFDQIYGELTAFYDFDNLPHVH